jgi:hypothetical protein
MNFERTYKSIARLGAKAPDGLDVGLSSNRSGFQAFTLKTRVRTPLTLCCTVVQRYERAPVKRNVAGSIPAGAECRTSSRRPGLRVVIPATGVRIPSIGPFLQRQRPRPPDPRYEADHSAAYRQAQ